MKLTDLNIGESGYILKIGGSLALRKRLTEMGFVRGQRIEYLFTSPLGNPSTYSIMGYELSLRRGEAQMIEISTDLPKMHKAGGYCSHLCAETTCPSSVWETPLSSLNTINVALIGNPNSGKTSLFNALSGGQERVGNYSGVTVSQKEGHINYRGYRINIVDLPGTYTLSAYSAEERYVQHYLRDNTPDVVVNVIAASLLKRHLYLTTELVDRDMRVVGALNMYDELEAKGESIDVESLSEGFGLPMIPVVATASMGTVALLDKIIEISEATTRPYAQVEVDYGEHLEKEIATLVEYFSTEDIPAQFPLRYWALRLLVGDKQVEEYLSRLDGYDEWCKIRARSADHILNEDKIDISTEITARKYRFIDDIIAKTLRQDSTAQSVSITNKIDKVVTNKWLGFPIFIALMWLTFSATFTLGAYPMEWIESGIEGLSGLVYSYMSDGWIRNFILDAIIGGAGGVLVFVPNIAILYLFIVLLESSGYMSRAAFIMDRLMKGLGLDGHSFIPLLMGFGCNVPAIMATRTIEDSKSRLISILINPFISCSARLPVFVLMAGTFMPAYGAITITALYLLGIVVAIVTAIILRKVINAGDQTALILELPPYRMPKLDSIFKQLWYKCESYIKRIGTVILLASAIIWALDYFPAGEDNSEGAPESYLSQVGRFMAPIVEPMGMDWRASVSLLTGIAAKEIVVSTMGVLYSEEEISEDGGYVSDIADDFTIPSAVAFMIFVLLYFPCTGTLAAIFSETNGWQWIIFSIVYSTVVAWLLAFGVYQLLLLML